MKKTFFLVFALIGILGFGQQAKAAPTVTAGNIDIDETEANGTGGEFIVDDVVYVFWDNSDIGDNIPE